MKEKIKDTIVDLLLDGVKEKLDSVKENYKWQKLFVSTGDFFVNNPDVLVKFEDDLYSVFSKDNLIRIAKRLKDKNGYDFSQLLHNELYDLMVSYEMCIDRAYTGADRWIKIRQHVKFYDINIQKEVFEKLVFICKKMSDEEKIRIKVYLIIKIF